jgi:hypothetical protein
MSSPKTLFLTCLLALAAGLVCPVSQAAPRVVDVQFARGEAGAVNRGEVAGSDYVDYRIRARAGQTVSVRLRSDRSGTCFNLLQAGREQALFVGSSDGRYFEGVLPADSIYSIRVYLVRSAARRNEKASFALEVGLGSRTGAPYLRQGSLQADSGARHLKHGTGWHPVGHRPLPALAQKSFSDS